MLGELFHLRPLAPLIAISGFIAVELEKNRLGSYIFKVWFLNIYPKDSLWKV